MNTTPRQQELLKRTYVDFQPMADFARDPLILERAQGLYYWDVAGKRYFDAIGGIFVAVLGHGHPRLLAAMRQQMEKMTFAPPLHAIADVTLEFIGRVGEVTPGNLKYVKGFSGGSESTEAAMKFARQYFRQTGHPGKYKFISRYHGYHGGTAGAMAASGTGPRKSKFEPQMAGFVKVFPPTHYRDQFSDWDECNRFAARTVEDVIINEDPETVAGVMVEPVGNTGGIITPTAEYFRILREVCDRYNVMLIFDEVITGFGRTGAPFAAQEFGVTPDMITLAKGLTNGCVPMGAVLVSKAVYETFMQGPDGIELFHGYTYSAHPAACAAGLATLALYQNEGLLTRAKTLGGEWQEAAHALRGLPHVIDVRNYGLILGLELEPLAGKPGARAFEVFRRCFERGVLVRQTSDVIALSPPLIIDSGQIAQLFDTLRAALRAD